MGRHGLIGLLAVCAALCAPATAAATGAYTWSQPTDFTATGSGSNPEHKYAAQSWSYPQSFQFSSSFAGDGTVAGWADNPSTPTTWIAVATGGSPAATQMVPPHGGSVALTWTSPFPATQSVTVSGSVSEPNQDTTPIFGCGTTWTLTNGSSTVASGGAGSISQQTVSVDSGDTLVMTVTDSSTPITGMYTTLCDETNVQLSLSAPGSPPSVTLNSPGTTITNAQPTFSGTAGTAFGDSSSVKVRVYSGAAASGSPIQTITTTASGGAYSVGPSSPLPSGTYTAQAEQDDIASPADAGLSTAHTFTIANVTPSVTLDSLGSGPLQVSAPTLTGTASTNAGDASQVTIAIWSGPSANGHPVDLLNAPVGAGGEFSVLVTPALFDGQYTAAAAQQNTDNGLAGISNTVTFEVKVNPPSLTLTSPSAGSSVASVTPTLSGAAGNVFGDSSTVVVTVWKGNSAKGRPVGTLDVTRNGSSWSGQWPNELALGLYTVKASQADNAGHTTSTRPHTFIVVPGRKVIGNALTLKRSVASISVSCFAPAGETCTGTVRILTRHTFQPSHSSPRGRLTVMFAHVSIPGGKNVTVRHRVSGAVVRALRHKLPAQMLVTAVLGSSAGPVSTVTGVRVMRAR